MNHWSESTINPPPLARSEPPSIEVNFSLATPMLGGGAEAKKVDLSEPFRATAIRGGIRWWWRHIKLAHLLTDEYEIADEVRAKLSENTAYGVEVSHKLICKPETIPGILDALRQRNENENDISNLDNWLSEARQLQINAILEKLKKSEIAVWGNAERPGSTSVDVSNSAHGQTLQIHRMGEAEGTGYAWKMLNEGNQAENPFVLQEGEARIRVFGDDPYLQLAVDLWLAFGGVGGRTRRGFGLLKPSRILDLDQLSTLLLLEQKVTWDGPTLAGGKILQLDRSFDDPSRAWIKGLEVLSNFRKGNFPSPTQRGDRGRGEDTHSRWPESNSLRKLQHGCTPTREADPDNSVPRAAFGLPIRFRSAKDTTYEFDSEMLEYGDEGSRWPSPVILRPLWNGQHWTPTAMIFNTPLPDSSKIRWQRSGEPATGFNLDSRTWPIQWWGPKGFTNWSHGKSNAVDAFAEYLTQKAGWSAL